ncbi:anti-sigma factor family protein [Rhodococcus sp. NPDC056960]|uniref:anti-sigma factor family protein n=1 Tax=Rhodococcus sp. NPDC056960 TaxID=3345982 RepID=UPI00362DC785
MDCQDLVELVTAYLEDELDPDARARFETHLDICTGCANYLDQMRQTVDTLGSLPAEKLDPALRDRLLNAFREWR